MTHGALFNGIAGFPLAASWAGIPTAWTVEIDEFCNKVSKKHFPDAIQYTDIRTATNLPYVDIISGGFPCQPFSVAGKQKGKNDDRFLWPEMLRIIREVKPSYILGENVAGIINMALDEVLTTLEAEGYTCETFVIPACALSAPHRRDRVWIIAYSNKIGNHQRRATSNDESQFTQDCEQSGNGWAGETSGYALQQSTTYTNKERLQKCIPSGISEIPEQHSRHLTNGKYEGWQHFPTQSPLLGGNDGLSYRLDRIGALGNAISPPVAYELFKAILQHATL